jgi:hypothetical protein
MHDALEQDGALNPRSHRLGRIGGSHLRNQPWGGRTIADVIDGVAAIVSSSAVNTSAIAVLAAAAAMRSRIKPGAWSGHLSRNGCIDDSGKCVGRSTHRYG